MKLRMKMIYVLMLLATWTLQAQPKKINWFKKAKVKTCQVCFDPKPDDDNMPACVLFEEYSLNGFRIAQTTYHYDDIDQIVDTFTTTYKYNAKGLLTTEMWDYGGEPLHKGYVYDDKERLVQELIASAESRDYNFVYNDKGLLTNKIGKTAYPSVDEKGELTGEVTWSEIDEFRYYYNEKKFLVKEEFYYSKSRTNYTTYQYDKKGRLIKQAQFYDDGTEYLNYVYEYDNKTNLRKSSQMVYEKNKPIKYSYIYTHYK